MQEGGRRNAYLGYHGCSDLEADGGITLFRTFGADLDAFAIEDMWPASVTTNVKMAKTDVMEVPTGASQKARLLIDIVGTGRILT